MNQQQVDGHLSCRLTNGLDAHWMVEEPTAGLALLERDEAVKVLRCYGEMLERLQRLSHPSLVRPLAVSVPDSPGDPVVLQLAEQEDWSLVRVTGGSPLVPLRAFAVLEQTLDLQAVLLDVGAGWLDLENPTMLMHRSGACRWLPPGLTSGAVMQGHSSESWGAPMVAQLFLKLLGLEPPTTESAWRAIQAAHHLPQEWGVILSALGISSGMARLSCAQAAQAARHISSKVWPYATAVRFCLLDNLVPLPERERLFAFGRLLGLTLDEAHRIEDFAAQGDAVGFALAEAMLGLGWSSGEVKR